MAADWNSGHTKCARQHRPQEGVGGCKGDVNNEVDGERGVVK